MPSAADGDFDPILTSKLHRLDDVSFVFGAQDNFRAPVGNELIPYHPAPEVFVTTIVWSRELAFDSAPQHGQVHNFLPRKVFRRAIFRPAWPQLPASSMKCETPPKSGVAWMLDLIRRRSL